MTPDRWARITDLLGDALDLLPESRPAFLAQLQIAEFDLADEVRSLLAEHKQPRNFLPELPNTKPSGDLRGQHNRRVSPRAVARQRRTSVPSTSRNEATAHSPKRVAVKLLSPAFSHASDWFQRERELLAPLKRSNIARLIDGGTTPEGWPYLVIKKVEGAPIDRYCDERDLALDDRVQLLLQACSGLAHAHQRLVVHCDVKPANILVTSETGQSATTTSALRNSSTLRRRSRCGDREQRRIRARSSFGAKR